MAHSYCENREKSLLLLSIDSDPAEVYYAFLAPPRVTAIPFDIQGRGFIDVEDWKDVLGLWNNWRVQTPVVWNTVLPTFAIIGAGVLYGHITTSQTSQISNYILYLAAPCLIVTSLTGRSFPRHEIVLLVSSDLLYIFIPGLVGLFVLDRRRERSLFLPIMFQNTGNLGLPLSLFAWGEAGMSKAIILYVTTSISLYTIGIWISAGKDGWKETFKLPLMYAVMISIALNSTGHSIPVPLLRAIDMIGGTTIPLLLFVLGIFLARMRNVSFRKTLKGAILRVGTGLIVGFVIVMVFRVEGLTRNIILLYSLMPSAVMTTIISDKYDSDPELVSAVVFTGTVISLILIPIMLSFLD